MDETGDDEDAAVTAVMLLLPMSKKKGKVKVNHLRFYQDTGYNCISNSLENL